MASLLGAGQADEVEEPYSPNYVEHWNRTFEICPDERGLVDPETLGARLDRYIVNMDYVQYLWKDSPERALLIAFVERTILLSPDIQIDNALCISLGTLGDRLWEPYHGSPMWAFIGKFWADNFSFHQLAVFETVLDTLKKKFDINKVAFQDMSFGDADVAFLQQRGHTVIPYPARAIAEADFEHGRHLDSRIGQQFSSSTFLFCPYLANKVIIEAVVALKPSLYLGTDFYCWISREDLANPGYPTPSAWDEFKTFAASRHYKNVRVLDPYGPYEPNQGFHWKRDPEDKSAAEREQERHKARETQNEIVNFWLGKNATERDKRKRKASTRSAMTETEKKMAKLEAKFRAHWSKVAEEEESKAGQDEKVGTKEDAGQLKLNKTDGEFNEKEKQDTAAIH
ncbi:hypothetical protein MMC25_006528 [Agyrium rufum]|nr:hypothetical protein [Agyrium rufum]